MAIFDDAIEADELFFAADAMIAAAARYCWLLMPPAILRFYFTPLCATPIFFGMPAARQAAMPRFAIFDTLSRHFISPLFSHATPLLPNIRIISRFQAFAIFHYIAFRRWLFSFRRFRFSCRCLIYWPACRQLRGHAAIDYCRTAFFRRFRRHAIIRYAAFRHCFDFQDIMIFSMLFARHYAAISPLMAIFALFAADMILRHLRHFHAIIAFGLASHYAARYC
jgi:hypothetical protein